VCGALLTLLGCQAYPAPGATGGRIDPYRSTPADVVSSGASMPALMEFCDQTAEAFAQDLAEVPEIRDAPSRVVLEVGSLRNETRTPTGNFEQIQARLIGAIFDSELIQRYCMVVEAGDRMDAELERINGPGATVSLDDLDGRTARYDPHVIYVLQGDFFESGRDHVRRYYFEFKLVNLASRARVLQETYDLGQASP
jgi:hypothetical protein